VTVQPSRPPGALLLDAPAKLNLSLRVVGRRLDGHHLLDSEFVLLGLADRLLLMPGSSGLRIDGEMAPGLPVGRDNLAWRGLVAGLGAEPEVVCLTLEKRIPAAAGLGGGSSDAAAAWRLGRAWRGLSDVATAPELLDLAAIGADVPFLAAPTAAAHVTGIGEIVEPVPPIDRLVVLAHPDFGLSTAAIFAELRPDEWGRRTNDLLAPALRLRPELAAVLSAVERAGGEPQLTGSGPTVFSMTDDPERAAALAGRLAEAGLRATITRTRTTPAAIEPIHEEDA
jgi:4-diphosphocytidyl-2-C-methyl-D-erythritol kinase